MRVKIEVNTREHFDVHGIDERAATTKPSAQPWGTPVPQAQALMDTVLKTLVAYRMVFGQPRQEDLVKYLQNRMEQEVDPDQLLKYRIDLSPISWQTNRGNIASE